METVYTQTPLGVPVVVESDPNAKTMAIGAFFRAGSGYDGSASGAAHFLEHMLFKGSQNYPSERAIHQLHEQIGANWNGQTNRERVRYWIHFIPNHLERALAFLQEVVCRPVFDEQTQIKERLVIANERGVKANDPKFALGRIIDRDLYGEDPYGRVVVGEMNDILTMEVEYLRDLYQQLYTKQNMVMVVVGPISIKEALKFVDERFGELLDGVEMPLLTPNLNKSKTDSRDTHPSLTQDMFTIGWPTFGWNDDRYFTADILADLMTGTGGRLLQALREQRGWVYGVGGGYSATYTFGGVAFGSEIDHDKVEVAIDVIGSEVERICQELVSDDELQRARSQHQMGYLVNEQEVLERMFSHGYHTLATRRPLDRQNEFERHMAVSAEDVRMIAQTIFATPAKLAVLTAKRP